jgi:hypothetical protein
MWGREIKDLWAHIKKSLVLFGLNSISHVVLSFKSNFPRCVELYANFPCSVGRQELPGTTFGNLCGQVLEIVKISFLGLLLAICAAIGRKCSKWASWGYFWPYVRPRAENAWSELPGLLLAICAARGWKWSEWASWTHFCPCVRPGPENAQNKVPGITFCYMCGHWLRMLKISFLGLLLAICAAKGWKYKKNRKHIMRERSASSQTVREKIPLKPNSTWESVLIQTVRGKVH